MSLWAERYIRFNQAGYFPSQPKRFIIMSNDDCKGTTWELKNSSGSVVASGTLEESAVGKGDYTPFKYNHVITITNKTPEGSYILSVGEDSEKITVSKAPYKDIITSNLRFIRVHRSGSNDVVDRKPAHFGDSSCYVYRKKSPTDNVNWVEDKNGKKIDVNGGWYEGNHYIKISLNQAYTTYLLLRAYDANPSLFEKKHSKTKYVDILDEARWGLEYLVKISKDPKEFIIQNGGFADAERGTLLPGEDDRDGKRFAYSAFSAPQMGNTIAALALGAQIFKKVGDTKRAGIYRKLAINLYSKAISKGVKENAWVQKGYDMSKDDTKFDNLLLASVELYHLTKQGKYLNLAKKYANKAKSKYWVSYADLNMHAHARGLPKVTPSKNFLVQDLDNFHKYSKQSANIWGFPMEFTSNQIYYNMAIASISAQYKQQTKKTTYDAMALNSLDYVFGLNSWGKSFVASERLKNPIRYVNSQIYVLQSRLYPEGAVVPGPSDTETHERESVWSYFDPRMHPDYKFNTKAVKYFDHSDDYVATGAVIWGVAEAVLFQSIMSKVYGK